ncbi:hypothetical protein [Kangiella shandongensis]|uniref:hypothetical protein n=1 Tax=Kangiella shandongensis TaxID=2763258 RepID=UPI001CC1330D|nr:hypothetical protein [Kangiella shandongensis]
MKRNLWPLFLCLLIVGCSHIPLSTMLSMSTFDEEDFVELDAKDIRAKIITNTPRKFVKDSTQLQFKLLTPNHKIDKTLSLDIISDDAISEKSWLGNKIVKHTTVFKLSGPAIKEFRALQQSPALHTRSGDNKFHFTISWRFEGGPPEHFTIQADLMLVPEDGYFTLIDNYQFSQNE